MIKAFRKQLKAMAHDSRDPFTQYIRTLAGPRQAVRFEAPLRAMILQMPDMILQIRLWADDTTHPWRIRRAHNFVLAYLYNPEDFLPEKREGLFGYIDDAYLIARVYEDTLDELRYNDSAWNGVPVSYDTLQKWLSLTRELLPDVTERIHQLLSRLDESPRHKRYNALKGALS